MPILTLFLAIHRKQHEGKEKVPFPKPNAIPAITVVVHNQSLFRALVSCLSSTAADVETESRPHLPPGSRKRAASISDPPESMASKSLKLAHSPQVGSKRTFSYSRPQMNVRTLAATILYISFEHFDHWPVPLVKAYAEDCFGPRTWVDEPACQLLVQNLALSHSADPTEPEEDLEKEVDALAVAEFYRRREETSDAPTASPVRQRGRGSISSLASQISILGAPQLTPRSRSMSSGSIDIPPPRISPQPLISPVIQATASSATTKDGEDSDSGDEEEVALSMAKTKKLDEDGSSSSSGEDDDEEVVVAANKSIDEDSIPRSSPTSMDVDVPPSFKPTYPVSQQNVNFKRIRHRYFGLNLEHAHLAISSSLNERLDVKSKQNSGLLQTLPSFASIPPVRSLITANLEKWLQSPALAGLARGLFSTTVGMMKNVDPPLPADLEAINNILSMRLKANQVSVFRVRSWHSKNDSLPFLSSSASTAKRSCWECYSYCNQNSHCSCVAAHI
jgi:integrator complex subunit 1